MSAGTVGGAARFLVARNPQADSRLPYLVRLPLGDGVVLKARAPWPATARVYCHASKSRGLNMQTSSTKRPSSSANGVGRRSISSSTDPGKRAANSSSPK
jgi:hypothetical protein